MVEKNISKAAASKTMAECVQLQAQLRKKRKSCIQHHQALDAGNLEAALLETMFSCTALPMGKRNSGVVIFSDCQEETRHWKQIDKKNDKQKQKTKITNGEIMRVGERTLLAKEKKKNLQITTVTL